jgi:hypothetical protein
MSSSQRGSSTTRTDAEEETNVDEVVHVADSDSDTDRHSEGHDYFDSLRNQKQGIRNKVRQH